MSYRKQAANITVRFFVGDAIPFAHTLQNKRITGASSAHWYRHQGRFGPLVLDGPDYGAPPNGPLTFDVIDTSNLADHLGGLNLLAATTPLLRHSPSSTLYTETLLRSGRKDQGEIVDDMLCGHVSTISALLDLFPAEYWTNTSDISHSDEQAFQSAMTAISFDVKPLQLLVRLSWKRPLYSAEGMTANSRAIASNMKPLHFTGTELASVLFTVFLRMFRGEDMTYLCSGLSAQKMSSSGAVPHHRASFVAFLRLVKTRVATDWHATMHALSELVRQRQGAPMNSNYFWELDTWMHLLHVHSVEMLAEWHNRHMPDPAHTKMFQPITSQVSLSGTRQGDLRDWVDMPPVVCVTLKVPRNKINVLISCKGWRTPSIACDLRGPGLSWLNISPACHFGFGRVSTTGMAHDNSYSVLVQEDSDGWRGSADLIVSFFAPSYWLQMAPRKATVGLRICPSPVSIAVFRNKLGLELKLYQTTLEDSARVFVTRYAPHQQAHPALPAFSPRELSSSGDLDTRAETKITAQVSEGGVINSLTARFDINLAEHKSALLGGCLVTTTRDSPCRVSISLGERYPAVLTACFPVFTVEASQKLRIARKTGYIELQCRVGDCHSWIESPLFMYPVWPPKERGHAPVVWNLPYLDLSRCPTLDTHKKKHGDLGWFNPHISSAFSWRERAMRENPALPCTAGERIRLDFKDSLFSILTQYTGLQGFQGAVFALSKPDGGGVHIMIVCAATRIDLSSRAVTLDCAVLPLRAHLIPRMQAFILGAERRGTIVVKVSREELHLWKTVLPACVERCRTWDHGAGCEYGAAASVPRTLADGEAFLCSCGHGRFPPGFLTDEAVPHWSSVERYAVRAALSPAFWAPFADRAYVPDLGPGLAEVKTRAKTKAGSVARPIYTGSDGAVNTTDGACAHCKQTAPDLKACGKCRSVKYCGATCQKEHWKQHKQVCKA